MKYPRKIKMFSKTYILFLIFYILIGCQDSSNPIKQLPLPNNMALYASIDGNTTGIWVFDPNTLKKIDSLDITPGVPFDIIFSPDNSTIYAVWGKSGGYYRLYAINNRPFFIKKSIDLLQGNSDVLKNNSKDYLIAYGYKGLEIFNRSTLVRIKHDSSFGIIYPITSSKLKPKLYFGTSRPFRGLTVYDLDSLRVIENISISDSVSMASMEPADIVVTPNDKYAFYSVFNWRGMGGFNKFYVIDLAKKKVIESYDCGAFSRLAITPDGRYVFISDPAGYLYQFQQTRKVLRYDVENKTMEDFIYPLSLSDRFAISPDSKTLFISSIDMTLPNSKHANIVKVDARTGNILGSYLIPLDNRGYRVYEIRNITLGIYNK